MSRHVKPQEMLPDLVRLLRHFWPYARKYRLLMFGAMATLVAQVGLRILEPWPLKFVFDRIIPTSSQGSGEPVIDDPVHRDNRLRHHASGAKETVLGTQCRRAVHIDLAEELVDHVDAAVLVDSDAGRQHVPRRAR